nr:MAG TPA: hypothetical protein [Caudoviricetes sp.]
MPVVWLKRTFQSKPNGHGRIERARRRVKPVLENSLPLAVALYGLTAERRTGPFSGIS